MLMVPKIWDATPKNCHVDEIGFVVHRIVVANNSTLHILRTGMPIHTCSGLRISDPWSQRTVVIRYSVYYFRWVILVTFFFVCAVNGFESSRLYDIVIVALQYSYQLESRYILANCGASEKIQCSVSDVIIIKLDEMWTKQMFDSNWIESSLYYYDTQHKSTGNVQLNWNARKLGSFFSFSAGSLRIHSH